MRQTVSHHADGEIETADKDGEIRIWVRKRMCYYCGWYKINDKLCLRPVRGAYHEMPMNRDDYCSRFIARQLPNG